MKPSEQMNAQLKWMQHAGITHFDLGVRLSSGQMILDHAEVSTERIQALLPWFRAENSNLGDIYFRASRKFSWNVVFLDDVPTHIARKITSKYNALVLETSPGSCHVWLATSQALGEFQRKQVQAWIARQIVDGKSIADHRSTSGEHFGRLAGFRNRKPGRDCWVNVICSNTKNPALDVSNIILDPLNQEEAILSTPRGSVVQIQPAAPDNSKNHSDDEWGWVMGSLESGMNQDEVRRRLYDRALPRRGEDTSRYVDLTIKRAIASFKPKVNC